MKLYRKKLNSVEELRRECIRLTYQKKHSDVKDLMPKMELFGKAKKKGIGGSKNSGILEMALSLINSKGTLQTVLALAGPVMSMIGKDKKTVVVNQRSRSSGFLSKVVKDIVIGYAVGKGIQLAVRGFKSYARKQREKKIIEKAAIQMQKATVR